MRERDFDVVTTDTHCIVHTQRSRFFVGHTRNALGHLFHDAIAVVCVRTAVVRCDFSIAQSCDQHVIRLSDVLRVLEDIEVLVLDLLALCALLTEVEQSGILFRTLDRLEELAACILAKRIDEVTGYSRRL